MTEQSPEPPHGAPDTAADDAADLAPDESPHESPDESPDGSVDASPDEFPEDVPDETHPDVGEPGGPSIDSHGQVHTGNVTVDAVLGSLEGLDDRPVSEHVEVFEHAHEQLRRALDGAGDPADR